MRLLGWADRELVTKGMVISQQPRQTRRTRCAAPWLDRRWPREAVPEELDYAATTHFEEDDIT
jgi:hypothetical protein